MALVDTLKHLAHQEGRTVITSIHQPSSSVFASCVHPHSFFIPFQSTLRLLVLTNLSFYHP